jgi:hypothetical protein
MCDAGRLHNDSDQCVGFVFKEDIGLQVAFVVLLFERQPLPKAMGVGVHCQSRR